MLKELLNKYPIGSDITIMNTFYKYPIWDGNKKVSDDILFLIYKDNRNGEKHAKLIAKPKYTYYLVKEGYEEDYCRLFIEKEKVEEVTVPFTALEKSIAENTDRVEFWKENIQKRDRSANADLHKHPDVFFSDTSIEDHYRFKFAMTYTNNIEPLQKAYFDIETDIMYCPTEFPSEGNCPINAVTYFDDKSDTCHTFLLRNPENPLIEQLEDEWNKGTFDSNFIKSFVEQATSDNNGVSQMDRLNLTNSTFMLHFFDDELEMIASLFRLIHECSPDFVLGWNSSGFDLSFIIDRIYVLGGRPEDIMCDSRFPVKVVKHFIDKKNINQLPERGDYTFISGYPIFMDQMIQYASRRKSKYGSINSFKLDDIGLTEAKIRKLNYHNITTDIGKLPYLDYKTFVLYNIIDTIVQKGIEQKTQDLEYIFSKCIMNNTSYKKGHRQSVYLINRMASDFYKAGYIIGNNLNKGAKKKPARFAGALVGDPVKTNDYSKNKLDGRVIWLCDNLVDFDFKSLYPSIILENNIAPNTQLGRINISNRWKVIHKPTGNVYFVKDPGNAHDFEWADIKEGNKIVKIRKQISLYEDAEFTKSVAEDIDYIKEDFETLEYVPIYEHENSFGFEKYSRSGEFIENFVTDNIVEFSKRWLHLAGIKEIIEDINAYYMEHCNMVYDDSPKKVLLPTTAEHINPFIKRKKGEHIRPLRMVDRKERMKDYERRDPRSWLNDGNATGTCG